MKNPIVKIHNVETGEVIEREMDADEFAQWQEKKSNAEAKAAAEIKP